MKRRFQCQSMIATLFALVLTSFIGLTVGYPVDAEVALKRQKLYDNVWGPDGTALSEDELQRRLEEAGLNAPIEDRFEQTAWTNVRSIVQWYSHVFSAIFFVLLLLVRPQLKEIFLVALIAFTLAAIFGLRVAITYSIAYGAYALIAVAFFKLRRDPERPGAQVE